MGKKRTLGETGTKVAEEYNFSDYDYSEDDGLPDPGFPAEAKPFFYGRTERFYVVVYKEKKGGGDTSGYEWEDLHPVGAVDIEEELTSAQADALQKKLDLLPKVEYITRVLCQRMMPEQEKKEFEEFHSIYEKHDACNILPDDQKKVLDIARHLAAIVAGKTPTQRNNKENQKQSENKPVQKVCKNICNFADQEVKFKITKWMLENINDLPEEEKMVCDWLKEAMEGKCLSDIAKIKKYEIYPKNFKNGYDIKYKKEHGQDCTSARRNKAFNDHMLYKIGTLLEKIGFIRKPKMKKV